MRSYVASRESPRPSVRTGFTLVEIVVAISVLTIGLLALAAGAAVTVRVMSDAARIDGAARRAESVREAAFSASCAATSGTDSVLGAYITWTTSSTGPFLAMRQSITLAHTAPSAITLTAAGACR